MAEFRRLISYIYEYEGRAKGKNVGFVKLETRNGMCRLSVNVKNLYIGSSDMGVYLMSGRKEIFLGNMFLRNGCGEFRTVVQVTDVQESGETMDECYGLTIHGKGEGWRVYTTIWEDAIAQAAQLTLESVTSEAVLEHEAEKLSSVVPQKEENTEREQYGEEAAKREKNIKEETERKADGMEMAEAPAERGRKSSKDLQKMAQRASGEPDGLGERREEEKAWEPEGGKEGEEEPGTPVNRRGVSGAEMTGNGMGAVRNGRKTWPAMNFRPSVHANDKLPLDTIPNPAVSGRADSGDRAGGTGQPPQKPFKPGGSRNIPGFEMGRLEMETEHPDISLGQLERQEQAMSLLDTQEKGDWEYRATGQAADFPEEAGTGGSFSGGAEENASLQKDTGRFQPDFFTESGQTEAVPVIRQHKEEPLLVGDPEALAKLDAEEALENQVPVWDFFSKTFPKIQAFDSEYGCQVLVIKPQDIGLLPREVWIYGNNSFLLHGYYNYRYLILARLENPKGAPRYLLGIPGHYYSNEKYMASMFGFPRFVLSKKQPAQDGRFGYWYTDIHMDDGMVSGNMAARKLRTGSQ